MIIIFAFFCVMFGILTGWLASRKGHDPVAWFFFGALLFIVALPLVLTLKPKALRQGTRACPYCGAITGGMECSSCGRGLPNIGAATVSSWEQTVARNDEVANWAEKQK